MAYPKINPIPLPLSEKFIANFWSKVKIGAPEECWPWMAALAGKGYGVICIARSHRYSHRLAYAIHTGIDPGKYVALHSCDNPPCCNPAHISLGTQGDNLRQASQRGRIAKEQPKLRGENNCKAKLTEEQIRAIRAETGPRREMAKRYGVHLSSILKIRSRETWKHIE